MIVPFLRRFRADWATETYLRRSLRNRKGYLMRKAAKWAAVGTDVDIGHDNDHGLDDDCGLKDDETGSLGGDGD